MRKLLFTFFILHSSFFICPTVAQTTVTYDLTTEASVGTGDYMGTVCYPKYPYYS